MVLDRENLIRSTGKLALMKQGTNYVSGDMDGCSHMLRNSARNALILRHGRASFDVEVDAWMEHLAKWWESGLICLRCLYFVNLKCLN